MNKQEIQEFINRMEEIGDVWKKADVKRVYGDKSLADALKDRMGIINSFGHIIERILNR